MRSLPSVLGQGRYRRALAAAVLVGAVLAAGCSDGEEGDATALSQRWLRLGEDHRTSATVYDRALPPVLNDLLNPSATADTPADSLVALPVHPSGELLGSYLLRRPDGSYRVWLFYDVPTSEIRGVTAEVTGQLDVSPWQVVGQQGGPSYAVVEFQSTRADDIVGTAVVEDGPPVGTFSITVVRGGTEQTLEVERAASTPLIEADLRNDLTVTRVHPGFARVAGLQQDDRIVQVGDTEVSDRTGLGRALSALGQGEAGVVSLTYLLSVSPPPSLAALPYLPRTTLALPEGFPLRDTLSAMTVDQYQTYIDPTGDLWVASILSEDSTSEVASRFRDALTSDQWEILSDQPVGFATVITFSDADGQRMGTAQIDLFTEDESFTQLVVQVQSRRAGGN